MGTPLSSRIEIHRPAADVHEQDRRLVLDEFRMDGNGGIPLWEQFHILDGDFVGDSLKLEAYRLGRTAEGIPGRLSSHGQIRPEAARLRWFTEHSVFSSALLDFFGDGCKGQQVVVVVLHLVSQDRLPAGPAHEELSTVLQRVLQGVGFVGIGGDTGWERKMPGFDGVVAMVDADVHGFAHPFLAGC